MNSVMKGVVLADMDGTLLLRTLLPDAYLYGVQTVACIDFKEMRRRAGVLEGDVLEVINSWPLQRRQAAIAAIEEVEDEALDRMQLQPGLIDLCNFLDQRRVPRGLVTRNSQKGVDHFHRQHFTGVPFNPALCRDFRPYKPSPAALLHICASWGIRGEEAIMIGDSPKDDVVAGNRAGAATILIDVLGEFNDAQDLQGELQPTVRVKSLEECTEVLRTQFDLVTPLDV